MPHDNNFKGYIKELLKNLASGLLYEENKTRMLLMDGTRKGKVTFVFS